MQAGRMRERVTVRNPVVTTDASGQAAYSYTGLISQTATVWASVRNVSQTKSTTGDVQPSGTEQYEVRIRYRADVDYDTRLDWGSQYLQVTGIENVRNLNHELRLECEIADQ